MTAAAMLALAGCRIVSDPPKSTVVQDVEFLRGCWVSKTAPGGVVTGFLRLLPPGIDAPVLEGNAQTYDNGAMTDGSSYSFARDGSSAGVTIAVTYASPIRVNLKRIAEPFWLSQSQSPERAVFAAGDPDPFYLIVDGDDDRLRIATTRGMSGDALIVIVEFEGERDGCD